MANEIEVDVPVEIIDQVDPLTFTPPPVKSLEPMAASSEHAAPLNMAEEEMIAAMQAALEAAEIAQPLEPESPKNAHTAAPAQPHRAVPWPVYVALCLFVGTVGGVTLKAVVSPAQVTKGDAHATKEHTDETHSKAHETHGSAYAEIDSSLGSGKYEHAYEDIEKHKAKHPKQWDAAGTYREALSLEGMKQYKAASKLYAQIANPDGDPPLWAVAALGQVRCAIARRDSAFANKLLSRIALQSGRPGMPAAINGECLYLRAQCELLDLGVETEVDPFNPNAISWPTLSTKLEHVLDAFPYGAAHPHEKHEDHKDHDDSAQHTADDEEPVPQPKAIVKADEQLVSWNRSSGSILTHVQGLAEQFHWELKIGAKESSELATRSSPVQVAGLPVGEVLCALLYPMNLEWKQNGTILEIRKPTKEVGWAEAAATLQRAMAVAPKHLAAPSARVCMANCEHEMGRTISAITTYQKFLDAEPASAAARDASYNLGLHHAKQGEWKYAKQQFLDVIDRSKGGRWQEMGRWWLGRVALDSGDIGLSLKYFRMLFESSSKDLRAGAVLGVAACHLFNDDVDAAQDVLLKLRAPAGEIQNIGAVFNTWVQQKLKPSAGRAERVYDSLKAANDLRGLGTIGLYLAGKMYRDMDDRTRMVDVYAFATLRCRGPIVVRMHYELAEFWNEFDNRDEARQRYLATAILEPDGWGRRAMVGLAGLALRDGEPKECLTLCKQYLQMREAQARDVLSLMGRAYEQLGKYRAAAECFAGKLPAE